VILESNGGGFLHSVCCFVFTRSPLPTLPVGGTLIQKILSVTLSLSKGRHGGLEITFCIVMLNVSEASKLILESNCCAYCACHRTRPCLPFGLCGAGKDVTGTSICNAISKGALQILKPKTAPLQTRTRGPSLFYVTNGSQTFSAIIFSHPQIFSSGRLHSSTTQEPRLLELGL
jgi:hypothetical protein